MTGEVAEVTTVALHAVTVRAMVAGEAEVAVEIEEETAAGGMGIVDLVDAA